MAESRAADPWSLRSWRFWAVLAAVSCVLIIGNVMLTHSWWDGAGMALLVGILAVFVPGVSSRPRSPQWGIGGARFWLFVGVAWLLYALVDWPLRGSFLVAAGRATLLVGAGTVLGVLVRKRRP